MLGLKLIHISKRSPKNPSEILDRARQSDCAKFWKDLLAVINVARKLDVVRFQFQMGLGRITCITTGPDIWYDLSGRHQVLLTYLRPH